ncbi:MAG: helix-turn-helix domain-containing protein [Sphingomonadales bacterium]|nr:helix-turn-helix domain-containing protein [Sphingomonadales bacterium]
MTAITLGEATVRALGAVRIGRPCPARVPRRGAPHRTGAPVRRDSIEAGTFEEMFFAVPAKGECDHLLRVARASLDAGRRLARIERSGERTLSATERAVAGLTASAVRVYEEICTLARLNRGRVYPSYDRLADVTGLGRATIARALSALEAAGFLVRQRRFARVAGEGAGPRYAQTSNAYRPMLPRAILGLLPRWMRPAPIPCDQVQRDADQAAERAAMTASLSARELAQVTVGGALGRMLAKLGAALDAKERESHRDPQPPLTSLYHGQKDVGLTGRQRSA